MLTGRKILIIEDDEDIAGLLLLHLQDLGCVAVIEGNGKSGLEMALANPYDLIILDLNLPGMEGLEVCRQLRAEKKLIPILMLTARAEIVDKVLGLELGADDYLTKPFSIHELLARVKVILRRMEHLTPVQPIELPARIVIGDLVIEQAKRKVMLRKKPIDLTVKEFELLLAFAGHPGRCYSRQELLEEIWGYKFQGYEHTVNAHINRLRAKIEEDPSTPKYIQTVWGIGYKFAELDELTRQDV